MLFRSVSKPINLLDEKESLESEVIPDDKQTISEIALDKVRIDENTINFRSSKTSEAESEKTEVIDNNKKESELVQITKTTTVEPFAEVHLVEDERPVKIKDKIIFGNLVTNLIGSKPVDENEYKLQNNIDNIVAVIESEENNEKDQEVEQIKTTLSFKSEAEQEKSELNESINVYQNE